MAVFSKSWHISSFQDICHILPVWNMIEKRLPVFIFDNFWNDSTILKCFRKLLPKYKNLQSFLHNNPKEKCGTGLETNKQISILKIGPLVRSSIPKKARNNCISLSDLLNI